jgi:outer membrane protein OmpA-like peptidoglycan-associated protein
MQEPPDRAATGAPATGTPPNGAGAAEFEELRRMLVGSDLDRIDGLQKRLDDPAVRSAETGHILSAAIKAAPGKSLREALEPVFEKSFQSSVRKHPREISDAIYPVMGPAIRTSIAAAIREFAESLNQIVERSASWRAIRWRIEARVTGRPFTELLLARSMLYSVEQVFLIHRKSGLLLMHLAAQSAVVKDADMVSGMFTAIQDFVSDSFTEGGQELETIDVGRYKLWIVYGSKALLVGAVSGTAPVELKIVFRSALEQIQQTLLAELDNFKQTDLSVFEPARPYLERCLLGQKAPEKRRQFVPWLVLAVVVALLAALVFVQIRNRLRWDAYVDALRQEPGIVVVRTEKSGSGGWIAGLKDPKAPDPASLLAGFRLDASRVNFAWQPYLSLNTPFAAERELEADLEHIRARIIRFDLASPKLPLSETGRIEDLAAALNRVHQARPEARFAIIGHTDEVGSAEANSKLSMDRAVSVSQALAAQGVPPSLFNIVGAGNSQPLRTGGSEWDRSANRSVSIGVNLGPSGGR